MASINYKEGVLIIPYIVEERRRVLETGLNHLKKSMVKLEEDFDTPIVAGDLNYLVYSLALQYIKIRGKGYNNISDAIKALTGAAHEVERRILDSYENEMIIKNGDIDV